MRAIEIEAWALRVINLVEDEAPIEDSRVELKARWPEDQNKAARQIAGSCNAAAGDLVLWLIGVDQVTGVVGDNPVDMATWWSRVSSEFDGQAPYVQEVFLSLPKGTVLRSCLKPTALPSSYEMLSMDRRVEVA